MTFSSLYFDVMIGNPLPDRPLTDSQLWVHIKDIMNRNVATVTPDASITSAASQMARLRISCLVVMRGKKVTGILSERDLSRAAAGKIEGLKVRDLMTCPVITVPASLTVLEASIIMARREVRRLVVMSGSRLIGIVTQLDLTRSLTSYGMWHTIADIMRTDIPTVAEHDRVSNIARLMTKAKATCVVCCNNSKPIGIVTERDILTKVISLGADPRKTRVQHIMSSPLIEVDVGLSVFSAARLMEKMNVRRLVVVKGKRLIGIVSLSDIFHAVRDKLQSKDEVHKRNVESSTYGIYTTDRSGKIKYCNSFMLNLLKINKSEIIGKRFLPKNMVYNQEQRLYSMHMHKEVALRDSSGKRLYVLIKSSPTKDYHGRVNGSHGIIRDVTAEEDLSELKLTQIALKESEERFKTIFEGANDGIACIDYSSKRVIIVNLEFSRITGCSLEELAKINVERNANGPARLLNCLFEVDKDRGYRGISYRHPNGILYLQVKSKVMEVEGKKLLVGFYSDVTEQTLAEKGLRQKEKEVEISNSRLLNANRMIKRFNQELEEKVQERTRELSNARDKIQGLLDIKTQFVNQVAHDIRTPLTPIMALLPIVKSKSKSKDDKEMMDVVMNNARYISEIVQSTLNISRIDSGTAVFQFDKLDLKELVDEVISNNDMLLKEKGVIASNRIAHTRITGDRLRLTEVFQNILINAIKYSNTRKRIVVFSAAVGSRSVTVSVADSGAGIQKIYLKKIFEEFFRVDPSRHGHSSGLGLAICKRVIERHGGRIWAESPGLGRGSIIRFKLPKEVVSNDKSSGNRRQ